MSSQLRTFIVKFPTSKDYFNDFLCETEGKLVFGSICVKAQVGKVYRQEGESEGLTGRDIRTAGQVRQRVDRVVKCTRGWTAGQVGEKVDQKD